MSSAPVSVVIPAHNSEAFIAQAIRSVRAQTLAIAEIIVVANDCTDRTKQIAVDLGAVVLEQKRRSIAAALNLAIKASTQPWIAFLDADDLWHEDKIRMQCKAIESCPNVGLVACDGYVLVDDEVHDFERRLTKRWINLQHDRVTDQMQYVSSIDGEFCKRFYLQTSQVMALRQAVNRAGFLDEGFAYWQTMEFFCRVLRNYPLAFVERPLVYQRRHSANHTRDFDAYWASYISMINRMLRYPDQYPPGAGEAFRECLKRDFHQNERLLARRKQ
jgi:Glycosyltransferases involved in cell wall biogenesis